MSENRPVGSGMLDLDADLVRRGTAGLGLASVAVGLLMALAPRPSARWFGIHCSDEPTVGILTRAVGVRDVVIGVALWTTATRGGDYAPWLLARGASDAGDATAVTLAMASGARGTRLVVGVAGALLSSLAGFGLYRAARPQTRD